MAANATMMNQPAPIETIHMKLPTSMSMQSSIPGSVQNVSKRHQKFKLEPLKILEPSNKKLNLPESQRIMFILEELTRQIEILEYIEKIITNDEKIRNLLRPHLSEEEKKRNFENVFVSMCQHHRALVDSYNKGDFSPRDLNRQSPTAKNRESMEILIKSSCKDILRVFNLKPAFYEAVKNEFGKGKRAHPQVNELIGKST